MMAHPILINRPIVVTSKGRAALPSLGGGAGDPASAAAGRVRQGGRRSVVDGQGRRIATACGAGRPEPGLDRKLAAEAIGTGLLVATVVGSGIMAAKLGGGNIAVALLGNTIPTGAALVVLISILGTVSGAHFIRRSASR